MGCDGGSIPRRDEMVKLKKKAEKVCIKHHMARYYENSKTLREGSHSLFFPSPSLPSYRLRKTLLWQPNGVIVPSVPRNFANPSSPVNWEGNCN